MPIEAPIDWVERAPLRTKDPILWKRNQRHPQASFVPLQGAHQIGDEEIKSGGEEAPEKPPLQASLPKNWGKHTQPHTQEF